MSDVGFTHLFDAQGRLFWTAQRAANNAAFSLDEVRTLNGLLAEPLAPDHLLTRRNAVSAIRDDTLNSVTDSLNKADAALNNVLDGNNNRSARRDAIDKVDGACDKLSALLT
jgi:hypothetical protein